jgi:pimeloyl-ACP methyl ester carboxylesterase
MLGHPISFRAAPVFSPTVSLDTPPPRPSAWNERLASWLFFLMSPRVTLSPQPEPPDGLTPFEEVTIERPAGRPGVLTAAWFPAPGESRGAVLLLHPWLPWGKSYFYRRGRLQALRAAGYDALAVDLPGFGGSGPLTGFMDRDVEAALDFLRRRAEGRPLHVWGVSSGGYWAHFVLSRVDGVAGAMFEDVSSHLLHWSWRRIPAGRPLYFFFRYGLGRSYRYLDLRGHAPALRARAVAYVGGEKDPGVRADETRELARLAGAECLIVPGADHLAAIKLANREVIELGLRTFERALTPPTPSLTGREGA